MNLYDEYVSLNIYNERKNNANCDTILSYPDDNTYDDYEDIAYTDEYNDIPIDKWLIGVLFVFMISNPLAPAFIALSLPVFHY